MPGEEHKDHLDELMINMYSKFKLSYYQKVLKYFQNRKASLTADEAYSVEAIYNLGNPTVGEFASFMNISPQSAAYKVNNLVKKNYITKTRNADDKREFRLTVTDHYMNYYLMSNSYIFEVVDRMRQTFSDEEIEQLEGFLQRIVDDLTGEISQPLPDVDRLLRYRDMQMASGDA